jgi:prepilin-type N-terminal cleavage/methylation domain-containing protein
MRPYSIHDAPGFTFIEILISLAVLSIIATFTVTAFRNIYQDSAERVVAQEVSDAFREARNNTIGAKSDTVYGVRVSTSSVTRFVGGTYTAGSASNTVYMYDAGVRATGTLINTNVVFRRLTGEPNATGTIFVVRADSTSTTTVTLNATGLVE